MRTKKAAGRYHTAPKDERTMYVPKTVFRDGGKVTFGSKAECRRASELILLEKAKKISMLQFHPSWVVEINGERFCRYTADNIYLDENGVTVIEEIKSTATAKEPSYKLRKKAAELAHGILVSEVIR